MHSEKKELFAKYFIFHGVNDLWNISNEIYVDSSYLHTGLSAYYVFFGDKVAYTVLHGCYAVLAIAMDRIVIFVQVVGAYINLAVY